MKRIGFFLLMWCALWCHGFEITLAEAGDSAFSIVLADDAIPAEQTAAEELKSHLERMTGAELPIVRAGEFSGGAMIAVGFNARLPEAFRAENYPDLGEEELVIDGRRDLLLLAGGRPRGALYAVYEFLEELGVRWYTPQESLIPAREQLTVQIEPRRYKSVFFSRTQVPGNGADPAWCARNRMNSFNVWGNPGEAYGGGIVQGPDMHTFWRILNPAAFVAHPEWAAMVDGAREVKTGNNHWGVCLANADLRRELVARTIDWLRRNPTMTDLWIGQNDGSPCCQCAECQALYARGGGAPAAAVVVLINELAQAMGEEFPRVRLKTLAYDWSLTPPVGMQLDPRVTVVVCATFPSWATLGKDAETEKFIADLTAWQKIARQTEAYLYSYPVESSWFPAPCLYAQAHNIQYLARHGVNAIHQELFGIGTGDGGDLADLRAWLSVQLLWHPEADVDALIEDFCRGYYGAAADRVLAALRLMHREVEEGRLPAAENRAFAVPGYVEPEVVAEVRTMLTPLYMECADPVLKKRLGYVLLPWLWADFWLGVNGLGVYEEASQTWGIPIPERARREAVGALIRELMIENQVGALRLGVRLNPHSLRLAEMTRSYPAVAISSGEDRAVVLPEYYGKMVAFAQNGVEPLKAAWGFKILDYPHYGYWSELFFGQEVAAFAVKESERQGVAMQAKLSWGQAFKNVAWEQGALVYGIGVAAEQEAEGVLRFAPLLDLNDEVFGLYPDLYWQTGDGWRHFELGRAGSMWYQAGALDLTGFSGSVVLVAADGKKALEFQFAPGTLGAFSYMYDRYDFAPAGTGRILELSFESPLRKLQAGERAELSAKMRVLNAAETAAFLSGVEA